MERTEPLLLGGSITGEYTHIEGATFRRPFRMLEILRRILLAGCVLMPGSGVRIPIEFTNRTGSLSDICSII
jgi:hypothetical protein